MFEFCSVLSLFLHALYWIFNLIFFPTSFLFGEFSPSNNVFLNFTHGKTARREDWLVAEILENDVETSPLILINLDKFTVCDIFGCAKLTCDVSQIEDYLIMQYIDSSLYPGFVPVWRTASSLGCHQQGWSWQYCQDHTLLVTNQGILKNSTPKMPRFLNQQNRGIM